MKQGNLLPEGKVMVPSMTDPDIEYEVDPREMSCTCPAFTKGLTRPCKHMRSVPNLVLTQEPPTRPRYGMAISALIKAVRLRRPEDVAYWWVYLSSFLKERPKLLRRVVIIGAEDNMSIGRMQRVSSWWHSGDKDMLVGLAQLLAICKTPNWWASQEGQEYILTWSSVDKDMRANKDYWVPLVAKLTVSELTGRMERASLKGDVGSAMTYFEALHMKARKNQPSSQPWKPAILLDSLLRVTQCNGGLPAKKLASLVLDYKNVLWGDTNYTGQWLYRNIVDYDVPMTPIKTVEVIERQNTAIDQWRNPKPIPEFYLDGVHTSGNDRRFAGTLSSMAGMVRAYNTYGRLDPEDKWTAAIWTGG